MGSTRLNFTSWAPLIALYGEHADIPRLRQANKSFIWIIPPLCIDITIGTQDIHPNHESSRSMDFHVLPQWKFGPLFGLANFEFAGNTSYRRRKWACEPTWWAKNGALRAAFPAKASAPAPMTQCKKHRYTAIVTLQPLPPMLLVA